LIKFTTNNRS